MMCERDPLYTVFPTPSFTDPLGNDLFHAFIQTPEGGAMTLSLGLYCVQLHSSLHSTLLVYLLTIIGLFIHTCRAQFRPVTFLCSVLTSYNMVLNCY